MSFLNPFPACPVPLFALLFCASCTGIDDFLPITDTPEESSSVPDEQSSCPEESELQLENEAPLSKDSEHSQDAVSDTLQDSDSEPPVDSDSDSEHPQDVVSDTLQDSDSEPPVDSDSDSEHPQDVVSDTLQDSDSEPPVDSDSDSDSDSEHPQDTETDIIFDSDSTTSIDTNSDPITPTVFINELHYDNSSGDVGERIEIAGTAGTDLDGWKIALYNGSSPDRGVNEYEVIPLSGLIPSQSSFDLGTIAFPVPGIQNGPADGVALITPNQEVIQLLSYEGSFTPDQGYAFGVKSTEIQLQETTETPAGFSIQLEGCGTGPADFHWAAELRPESFGTINESQNLTANCGN